ncbi:hypothetical protein PTKIN_Ptkin09bG0241300 [Pterospermum kingtungense]
MANAAGEEMTTQIYAKPENGSGTGSTTDPSLIDDLIFEALRENPNPDSEIQKAVKLVKEFDEEISEITVKLNKREVDLIFEALQVDESRACNRLRWCEKDDIKRCRSWLTWDAKELASRKRDLDLLTFANNAYKEKAIKTEENIINCHNLSYLMHHGTRNMAMENKLLKEVNACQNKLPDDSDSDESLVEKINCRIWKLQISLERNGYVEPANRVNVKQARKEIRVLKWTKEKAIINASVNGKIWKSLPSKDVIKQEIKHMEEASYRYNCHYSQRIDNIKVIKQNIDFIKKDIRSMKKQLLDVQRKKKKAYEAVLKLIKI